MIYGIAAVTAIALALVAVGLTPSRAQEPPPILIEPLTPRSIFTDQVSGQFTIRLARSRETIVVNMPDPSRTVVTRITVQPGAQFPWHTHSGPVVVNIAQGELTYVPAEDCLPRRYPAGTAFVDPGHGHVHTAVNRTDSATVFYATFFQVPAEGPLTILAEAPANCRVGR
ncbi:MAG TPA: cupin domain-containing protein [Actinomycetota bacterium]|nr:cupin domain-containing protein [Actinomycetota bacterium]